MKIEVLGTGCSKCVTVYENAQKAIQEKGIAADIVKVTTINEIMKYGVMLTPAFVINGKVKIAGRVPTVDEIQQWIEDETV